VNATQKRRDPSSSTQQHRVPLPPPSMIYHSENTAAHLGKNSNGQVHDLPAIWRNSEIRQTMAAAVEQNPRVVPRQQRTVRRTYHVGKNKSQVSVLVSNKTLRNRVTAKTHEIRQKSIEDVKRFLIQKGFVRVGTTAPNDVLRKMYLIRRFEEDHPGVPIIGGMASGGHAPGSNTLLVGPRSYDSGAVGAIIGGGVRVRPVVSQGCKPIGRPLVITKAEENVIVELGGRPALERLREIYGDLDDADRQLVRSSLHVGRVASEYQESFQRGDFLVRNVVGADPDSGVIAVGDLVRTGQTIQFHVRDAASAHDDLHHLLSAQASPASPPAGALVFTCNGRGSRLFPEASHDARCLQECLGPVAAAGFFAQGEIGPIGRRNCLHGFTASIALFEQGE
jgi:hypothetical protein